jgi:hypothetical protein
MQDFAVDAVEHVPVVTLTNGIRVANFSSPHTFTFTDGSVLPACAKERALHLMLQSHEREIPGVKGSVDLELTFEMSLAVEEALITLNMREDIDIVLVPLPVLQALKDKPFKGQDLRKAIGKCRVCRVSDRVSKTIHHDRFCR